MTPHPFSLRQLQYAVAIDDARSFRRAAERCHVSQPSLSAQLSELESALGVRLFERDRRRVLPTPAAEPLLRAARALLLEADDLVAGAQRLGDPLSGPLRIGIIPTLSPYVLPTVAPSLRKRHPRLTVRWVEDKTASVVAALEAGELDAILAARTPEVDRYEQQVVADDPFVLAGRADDPLLRRKQRCKAAELDGARVLLLEDGHCFRDQALAVCAGAGAHETEFRATSLGTLAQMVAGGAGVTLLPLVSLPVENRRGLLAIRHFAPRAPSRTIVLAWRRRSPLAAGLRELADSLREAFPR